MTIIFLIYAIAGYWATGQTIYANKIIFHAFGELFMRRLIFGIFLGWILIPVAILKNILFKAD